MKKLFAVVAATLLSATAFAGEATTTVKISGWHCSGCASDTAAAIKKIKGVKSATPDFEKSEVVVAYDDSQAKPADFEKAVKKTGYDVAK